jgi:hypothetical protein
MLKEMTLPFPLGRSVKLVQLAAVVYCRLTLSCQVPRGESNLEVFRAHITGLNAQFSTWVAAQRISSPSFLWVEGAKDYVKAAEGLLQQFCGAVDGELN